MLGGTRGGQRLWGYGLLGLALLLLVAALPSLVSAWTRAPAEPLIDALRQGRDLSLAELDWAAARLEEARARAPGAQTLGDRALVRLEHLQRRAELDGEVALAEARSEVAKAKAELEAALARAPARPHFWLRRAYADLMLGVAEPEVGPILVQARRTAPTRRQMIFRRIELSLLAWPALTPGVRRDLAQDLRLAWRLYPPGVAKRARMSRRVEALRDALAGDAEALSRLEKELQRLAPGS